MNNEVKITDDFIFLYQSEVVSQEPRSWGGRWEEHKKRWRLPRLALVADRITRTFPDTLWPDSAREEISSPVWGFPKVGSSHLPAAHPSWATLFSFQREGVEFLMSSPLPGSLLALSPGLGKSAAAVVAAELLGYSRVLIVAPLSLTRTWQAEIDLWSWYKIEHTLCYGEPPADDGWVITNYATATGDRLSGSYQSQSWDLLIIDESIKVKNRKTKRFKQMKRLRTKASKVWELSGLPISRYVDDLWSQFHLLVPGSFTSFWRFVKEYCVTTWSPWSQYDIIDSRASIDFRHEFRDLMFVRNQQDVLDLPDIIFHTIHLGLHEAQHKAYRSLADDFITLLESGTEVSVSSKAVLLTRLLQITSNLMNVDPTDAGYSLDISTKADAIMEIVNLGVYEMPMLIWVHWRPGAQALYSRLERKLGNRVSLVLGGEGERAIDKIENYKKGLVDVLILSLGVGKYGHTLVNTKTAIYFDKTFDMDAYMQSQKRIYRIGLEHSPVVLSLTCDGTVDEYVNDNLARKAPSIAKVSNENLVILLRGLGRDQ